MPLRPDLRIQPRKSHEGANVRPFDRAGVSRAGTPGATLAAPRIHRGRRYVVPSPPRAPALTDTLPPPLLDTAVQIQPGAHAGQRTWPGAELVI